MTNPFFSRLALPLALLLASYVGMHAPVMLAADAIPGEQWCDRKVDRIGFSGNRITRDPVLRRELAQQTGTDCLLDDVIDGIQNIMDLGLFKSVRAQLDLADDELTLRYIVVEKIFFLPIPRFSRTSDGELRLGAQLRWDNFLGRLHQLKLTSEKRQEDDGRGRSGYVHKVDYQVPRFFGSRYGMSLSAASERRNTELARDGMVFGDALKQSRKLRWQLARWLGAEQGVRGLSYFVGMGLEQRDYEVRTGTLGPFSGGRDFSVLTGFTVQRVHQDDYRRRGHTYGASLQVADKFLGTDFRYARLDIFSRWYLPLDRPQTNLNIQARVGLSDRSPYGERTYEIGGGDLLRGMQSGHVTGNILTLLNVEYLSGFFTYPAWRWLLFTDIGNVYLPGEFSLLDQKIRAGAGLRWKLESLTNADLRLDAAWDPDKGKFTPYVSTSLTF